MRVKKRRMAEEAANMLVVSSRKSRWSGNSWPTANLRWILTAGQSPRCRTLHAEPFKSSFACTPAPIRSNAPDAGGLCRSGKSFYRRMPSMPPAFSRTSQERSGRSAGFALMLCFRRMTANRHRSGSATISRRLASCGRTNGAAAKTDPSIERGCALLPEESGTRRTHDRRNH